MTRSRSLSQRVARQGVRLAGSGVTVQVPENHALEGRTGPMTLVLPDFPLPEISRALSPNGRVHWAERKRARDVVQNAVWEAWVSRQDEVTPVPPPAHVTYRWIVPDRKARDLDNHSTGVVKAAQDTLVRLKLLPGGDHAAALTSTVEIVYEKGQRRLEIVLEHTAPAREDGLG